ncbi:hypothetical protein ATO2_04135 [Roseovarius sp. 22II1-1F6A]|nr:DUF2177 domain-containing protein [Actibacterium sp.]OWU70673.1 hypothetical protein ATO2_04135 [Roseovarius sp. 22II1-1F6A]|tara:strand:- start:86 stop:496 length:411 start_codon:yes stop_codon:yes gene_type:complete
MQTIILYVITVVLFLGLDAIGLTRLVRPVFEENIGHLLLDDFRLVPAALFYMAFVAGLLWFVSEPALRDDAPMQALLNGAILGFLAYGTYEFTSLAVMRDWSMRMVAVDVAWGTVLTGVSAWGGVVLTRWISTALA